jgi:periplasmic divalent cation tolerance protein
VTTTAATHSDHIIVLTTLPGADAARTFVRRMVEERVAACGTVLPAGSSLYWWQGAIEEATEVQVILKTRRDRFAALSAAARRHHPYDVPELLALPVVDGLPAYLEWVTAEAAP